MRLLHRINPHRKHGFPSHRRDPWGTANTGTVRGAAWAGCPAPGAQAAAPAWWAPPDIAQLTGRRAPARGVGSLVPGATWSLWASWSRVRAADPGLREAGHALPGGAGPVPLAAQLSGLSDGLRPRRPVRGFATWRENRSGQRCPCAEEGLGSGGPVPLPPPPTSPGRVPGAPGSFGGSAPSGEEGVHADAEVTGPVRQPEAAVSCGRRTRRPQSRRT